MKIYESIGHFLALLILFLAPRRDEEEEEPAFGDGDRFRGSWFVFKGESTDLQGMVRVRRFRSHFFNLRFVYSVYRPLKSFSGFGCNEQTEMDALLVTTRSSSSPCRICLDPSWSRYKDFDCVGWISDWNKFTWGIINFVYYY